MNIRKIIDGLDFSPIYETISYQNFSATELYLLSSVKSRAITKSSRRQLCLVIISVVFLAAAIPASIKLSSGIWNPIMIGLVTMVVSTILVAALQADKHYAKEVELIKIRLDIFASRNNLTSATFYGKIGDGAKAHLAAYDPGARQMSVKINDSINFSTFLYKESNFDSIRCLRCLQLRLPRKVPHIMLDSRRHPFFWGRIHKMQEVSLEGNFGKYFKLFLPPNYQIDTLQIFTPDVMDVLMQYGANYSIELFGDNLYLYFVQGDIIRFKPDGRIKLFLSSARHIYDEFRGQAKNYSDHRVKNWTDNYVKPEGARLKSRTGWKWIVTSGAIAIILSQILRILAKLAL